MSCIRDFDADQFQRTIRDWFDRRVQEFQQPFGGPDTGKFTGDLRCRHTVRRYIPNGIWRGSGSLLFLRWHTRSKRSCIILRSGRHRRFGLRRDGLRLW
jgi:hypothetical protein